MTTKKIFYNLLIATVLLSSCQKDLDVFVPDTGTNPDNTWYNTIDNSMPVASLKAGLLLDAHKDSFALNTSTVTVSSGSGLQCSFPSGSLLSAANQPVTGNILLETHLLKSKGDIIRMGTPTTSDGRLLVSGGEFYLRLTQNGNELHTSLQNGHYYIIYPDSAASSLMRLFNGSEASSTVFNWMPDTDNSNSVNIIQAGSSYAIFTNKLHWINCDHFYDTAGIPQTIVSANLPPNYTNANTIAFTVFNDMRSVVGMYGDINTRKFSTGRLPANKQITVVIISKQGNNYYLGHEQAVTTGSTSTVSAQQVNITPVIISLDDIKAYLNNL